MKKYEVIESFFSGRLYEKGEFVFLDDAKAKEKAEFLKEVSAETVVVEKSEKDSASDAALKKVVNEHITAISEFSKSLGIFEKNVSDMQETIKSQQETIEALETRVQSLEGLFEALEEEVAPEDVVTPEEVVSEAPEVSKEPEKAPEVSKKQATKK